MPQRVMIEEDVFKLVIDPLRRRIVIALDFIADHFHLFIDFGLRITAVENDVGEQVNGPRRMLL